MNDIDFIFTNKQYETLRKEYTFALTPNLKSCTETLNTLIKIIENQPFNLSINLQTSVHNTLLNAKQILDIISPTNNTIDLNLSHNCFELIHQLTEISIKLTSHSFKSPYQTLCLKSNNLILFAIKEISNYFANKKLKMYKFM